MLFSTQKNFIFIHVKKTGGTSILNCLRDYCLPHKTFKQHITAKLLKSIVQDWDSFFTFGFVRNPLDWAVSYYEYILQCKKIGWGEHPKEEFVRQLGSFDEFVRAGVRGEIHEFVPQKTFLFNGNDQVVNFVGRFENLQEDFDKICQKLEIPPQKLAHEKRTQRPKWQDYYSDKETYNLVKKHFKEDFEAFGY